MSCGNSIKNGTSDGGRQNIDFNTLGSKFACTISHVESKY